MVSIGSVIHLQTSGTRLRAVGISRRLLDAGEKKRHQARSLRSISFSIKTDHAIMATSVSPSPLILTSGASGRVNALFSLRALRSFLLFFHGFLFLLLSPFQRRVTRRASSVSSSSASMEKPRDEKQQESSSGSRAPVVLRVPAAMVPRRAVRDQEVLARRAMAIRRLAVDDGEEKERGRCERCFSLFVTSRGDTLFTQSWSPVTAPAKGLVVLLHGLNEHSGRYNHFAKQLTDKGFKVYGMDWIGHGGSDGLHGYVHSLDYAANDLKEFLEKVLPENSGLPCFCFGHSTGGAIVLKVVLEPKIAALIEGVVLTSPAVGVQPSHPIFGVIAPILSLLVPKYQFSAANKKGPPVSRDPEALVAKYSDPLVFTGSIRIRTGSEILRISSHLQRNLSKVKVPFLVLHGTADTLTDPEASQKLYEEASSSDKSIKLYEGFLHDLLFEPEREDIEKDIVDWLSFRLENLSGVRRSG